jgi:hypothetical protein
MGRLIVVFCCFLAISESTSAQPPSIGFSLNDIEKLMDNSIPNAEDGWSAEVSDKLCGRENLSEVLRSHPKASVEKRGAETEIHVTRTVWFLARQTLVVSRPGSQNCSAWIYVKPFLN